MSECLYDRLLSVQKNNIELHQKIDALIQENFDLKNQNTELQINLDQINSGSLDLTNIALELDYRLTLQENGVKESDFV